MNNSTISLVTELVLREIETQGIELNLKMKMTPVSISARHLHLKKEHLDFLFGEGHELIKIKDISQPGQFAAEEKVTLIGPKGIIENVRVLGPIRKETQVEVSASDARNLGVQQIIRVSGDLQETPGIVIKGPKGTLKLENGCIVAKRHIHMTPKDALNFGVQDKQIVKVKSNSIRGGILDNVAIVVREDFALDMHIDVDEANAFSIKNGDMLEILK